MINPIPSIGAPQTMSYISESAYPMESIPLLFLSHETDMSFWEKMTHPLVDAITSIGEFDEFDVTAAGNKEVLKEASNESQRAESEFIATDNNGVSKKIDDKSQRSKSKVLEAGNKENLKKNLSVNVLSRILPQQATKKS